KSGSDGFEGDDNGWDIPTGGSFGDTESDDLDWDVKSMWSSGLTKEHFNGVSVPRQKNTASDSGDVMSRLGPKEVSMVNEMKEYDDLIKEIEQNNSHSRAFVDGIKQGMMEMSVLLKQVKKTGARGSYIKDSEKTEIYRLHKENPEKEEERKLGRPLDDSVERLLDECPEFFISHDREFHVASLKYKPVFKVMPEGWDGTIKDMDGVHYEISKKEDDMLYEEFVRRFEFNKMKWRGEVKCHKYSRWRSSGLAAIETKHLD
ncbi:hypothetical protein EUTSA_v10000666mg, partial [Eutrema salsugineum]